MAANPIEPTHFLNVDLDVEGRAATLAPLVALLDQKLFSLHTSTARGRTQAHYEIRSQAPALEPTLRALLTVLGRMPAAARRAWDAASKRDFNVGLQAGRLPHASEYAVSAATLARVAALGGRLVVTVYAPFPRPRSAKRARGDTSPSP